MPRRPPQRYRPVTSSTLAGALSLIMPAISCLRIYSNSRSLLPLGYTCAISGITFLLYGYDKMQARNMEWRVKEITLHTLGLLGGWPGALVGMHFFQHKTRKAAFQIPFWMIVSAWQFVWWVIWNGDFKELDKALQS
ncbi:DUF1294-domain-containing protein [Periconia macrospinosa]|uniref:DUF1294-domain-containing protein n=1 Tax=Periconia macrospinosa TaxID=97972 RepID=A0A2V1EDZ7_9PLEO|nr:DUF1294-domain-containing protein [Periconia macrospinosa]